MIKKSFEKEILDTYWAESLKNKLNKIAVQPKRVDDLLFRVNEVVDSKKSKFSSVEDKVSEMIERSGLAAYLKDKKIKLSKKAELQQETSNETIETFKKYPNIKKTIDNIIEDSKGTLPVIGIVDKVSRLHEKEIKDNTLFQDNGLKKYIAQKNLEYKAKPEVSNNLGKNFHSIEQDEQDLFLDTLNK